MEFIRVEIDGNVFINQHKVSSIKTCRTPYPHKAVIHGITQTSDGPCDVWMRNDGTWTTNERDERNLLNRSVSNN